jgi:chromosome segregation ATPase
MSDIENRLSQLKNQIEQGKREKAMAEANLETFTKRKEELVGQLAEMSVKPEELDTEIERLDKEIEANLAQAEQLLGLNQTATPQPTPSASFVQADVRG